MTIVTHEQGSSNTSVKYSTMKVKCNFELHPMSSLESRHYYIYAKGSIHQSTAEIVQKSENNPVNTGIEIFACLFTNFHTNWFTLVCSTSTRI